MSEKILRRLVFDKGRSIDGAVYLATLKTLLSSQHSSSSFSVAIRDRNRQINAFGELSFSILMADHTFVVGQEFSDVKAFRNAIKEAAIAQHFELRIIKSDLIRYFAKCATEGCPWRIRAVKLSNAQTFTIRSLEGTHTCGRNAHNGHHQASVDWIVSFIEERLRDDINYKPKDILHDIQKQYGITIPYKQAWRAKERGLAAIYGSSEEGYCLLPSYCEQIKKSNPGSVAEYSIGTTLGVSEFVVLASLASESVLAFCLRDTCWME
ncbi:hypothetical protein F8388_014154 [Cannabis sativa]|uniref:Transposase MuDR plant domain-containing protein n=1 Tax=Cannabis sativa TaxID=3483 RepID=A0A7J6GL50_CANSA|nr:hypothetical protein F8388_014154 [Cannabis sativa]